LFAVQNEILSLSQGEAKHIRDYVYRVEKLSGNIHKNRDSLFAIAFIKGMGNEERHQRVTFDLQDCPNCSFLNPLTVVKFSFQEIGEPDLFHPTHKSVKTAASRSPLYSLPVIPQVNTLAVTDVPRVTTQQPALLASMTQKQFNNVMSSYETTMRRSSRIPYIPSGGTGNNWTINARITCFNSRLRRHYSDMCTNSALSIYEEQQIRGRLSREREQSEADYRASERHLDSPLSGSNAIEVIPHTFLQRPVIVQTAKTLVSMPAVSCIRSCKVSNRDLENACIVASQIPAVRTIFESAVAENRARVEDRDSASVTGRRAPEALRRFGELTDNIGPRRSLRSSNNPLVYGRSSELDPRVEQQISRASSNLQIESPTEIADNLEESRDDETEILRRATLQARKGKAKVEIAPINWMKGQIPLSASPWYRSERILA